MKISLLACASALCFLSLACDAVDSTQKIPVPEEILSFVGSSDTLLAYKSMDLTDIGHMDAVIIVRHQKKMSSEKNPCELILLERVSGTFLVKSRSSNIVDCKYSNYAKNIAKNYSDLNKYLQFTSMEISYSNIKPVGHANYYFKFSRKKRAWYVSKVDIAYSQSNENTNSVEVVKESASYPKDFGWILMSTFNPDTLKSVLDKNRSIVN